MKPGVALFLFALAAAAQPVQQYSSTLHRRYGEHRDERERIQQLGHSDWQSEREL